MEVIASVADFVDERGEWILCERYPSVNFKGKLTDVTPFYDIIIVKTHYPECGSVIRMQMAIHKPVSNGSTGRCCDICEKLVQANCYKPAYVTCYMCPTCRDLIYAIPIIVCGSTYIMCDNTHLHYLTSEDDYGTMVKKIIVVSHYYDEDDDCSPELMRTTFIRKYAHHYWLITQIIDPPDLIPIIALSIT